MTDEPHFLFDVTDGIATITMNRPKAFNAMSNELMGGIIDSLKQVEQDEAVRVVILAANGKGFCAGADLGGGKQAKPEGAPDDFSPMRDLYNPAADALRNCSVPTIARVNGAAAGGGFGLALSCDITIASKNAFFVATFIPKLGIVPDIGATWSIPRNIGRARAMGISLLGDRIKAEEAADWGLIWKAVEDEELDAEIARTAALLKRSSPDAIVRARNSIDAAFTNSFSDQLGVELRHQDVLIPRNMKEGARAFRDKRDPEFDGARYKKG